MDSMDTIVSMDTMDTTVWIVWIVWVGSHGWILDVFFFPFGVFGDRRLRLV